MKTRNLIRFDWALKRLLRNKANFVVLEGFLSVLLKEDVKIINIKESEANQEHSADKFNRVDIVVENNAGELIIIEIQINSQVDYFMRMLFGVAKAVTEHMSLSDRYFKVKKVYHINIIYFRLGDGNDYVYHGTTEFRGIHKNNLLQLTKQQKEFFKREKTFELFPEYFILCVNDFDNVAKDRLDEWIYYLKNNEIPDRFTAPGLEEARKRLLYDKLTKKEQMIYNHHLIQSNYELGIVEDAEAKGVDKGIAIGFEKGEAEREKLKAEKEKLKAEKEKEKAEKEKLITKLDKNNENVVINSHKTGLSPEIISTITGLTVEEINRIIVNSK